MRTALARADDALHIPEHAAAELDAEALRRDYETAGCVIIRGAIDLTLTQNLQKRFKGLFCGVLDREGAPYAADDDLDALHAKACAALGPERSKHFLTMGRDMPAFNAIVSAPRLLEILGMLYRTDEIQTVADSNVFRIDLPSPNLTNLDWHQDYPYNMLASCAATAWMPIRPVMRGMGRLRIAPRSAAVAPIEYDDKAKKQFHNSGYVRLKDLDKLGPQLEREAVCMPEMFPGDVLLLHALTLHRSGVNTSSKARWVATARYGPFMDEALYKRTWFTARAKYPDIFQNVHPDLFRRA